jgi:ParB family chromosome partitioning protein
MSSSKHLARLLGTRVEADAATAAQNVGVQPLSAGRIIQVARIVADPGQPRREFDDQELDHLAASLRDHGQTDPVKVRWDSAQSRWVLIDGERRWRAAQRAGLLSLSAVVESRDLAADRLLEMQVVENALRQDLTVVESGRAFRHLMAVWGCSQQELAARLHISQSKVSRCLQSLDLPAEVQSEVESGKVGGMAAVMKSRRKPETGKRSRGRPAAPRPLTITTPVGTVVVKPKAGQTVEAVLMAAIDAHRRRGAA